MHILGSFDEALGTLRNNVLMMASLTERNLERAFRGLFERDEELCNLVIADDEEIDTLEKQVDKDGIELLLRFQPVAIDLRSIIAAMKLGPISSASPTRQPALRGGRGVSISIRC
jgi:phosphate transport system protein